MPTVSDAYRAAEERWRIPPVATRGRTNENPEGIGFWALVAEDYATHGRKPFEQGFWALFWHRFGNWRMGQPKVIRAPSTALYLVMFKLTEILCGISLWYTVKLGRRVRIWHHSGMVIGNRAIGDDCHIRQNTTIGVGQTGVNDALPIIGERVDIGAGACIAGAVFVGDDAKIGGNALVVTDVPAGAVVMGNPAQVVMQAAQLSTGAPAAPPPATCERAGATADGAAVAAAPPARATAASHPPAGRSAAPDEPMRETPVEMGRIALLGSANLDYLAMSMKEAGARYGLALETVVPEFGTARMELLKPASESALQQAMQGPLSATLVVERAEDVLGAVATAPLSLAEEDAEAFLDDALAPLLQTVRDARAHLAGPLLVLSLAAVDPPGLGLADAAEPRGRGALIARANARLAAAVADLDDTHLIDGEALIAEVGRAAARPGTLWHMGRLPFSEAFNAALARRTLGALLSLRGRTARILMLDLDNTLWGGVLGEDGPEGLALGGAYPGSAYKAFQAALKALADRGIALAVTSKNDADQALAMIAEHPEMVLRPESIVAHRIDWNEKALNIQEMLDEIGLGAGSCMFIDDNPVERAKVRRNLPDCIVPAFPAAPEDLVPWLLENPYLDCLALTASDLKRTSQYRVRARVSAERRNFASVEDFYASLGMRLTFEPLGPLNQQRALQLFAKTNQFNATSRRHDAQALGRILETGGEVFAVGVEDRHADYELMGVLVLRPDVAMAAAYPEDAAVQALRVPDGWWVDSFLMSCRILGRTIETAILAWATARVAEKGGTALVGQIVETPRNTPVRRVFATAGFAPADAPDGAGAVGLWIHRMAGAADALAVPAYFEIGVRGGTGSVSPRRPAAPAPAPPTSAPAAPAMPERAAATATATARPDAASDAALDALFRRLFGLGPEVDLAQASMDTVEAWDSIGHLKLAMEVERTLGVALSGEVVGSVRSYPDLATVVTGTTSEPIAAAPGVSGAQPPPERPAAASEMNGTTGANDATGIDRKAEAALDALFRELFRLRPDLDLATASMDTVDAWDSLGHLKLAMEVERRLGVHLPGDAIGSIRSYADLSRAVGSRL